MASAERTTAPRLCGSVTPSRARSRGRFTQFGAALNQAIEVQSLSGSGLEGDALVHGTTRDLAKTGPGDFFDKHSRRLGIPEQLQELEALRISDVHQIRWIGRPDSRAA